MYHILNTHIELFDGNWIIWKNHSADFRYGSYYQLNQNGTIDYVIVTQNDVKIVENIKNCCNLSQN